MSSTKVIFVTGANRGIGYATVQRLSTTYPENIYLLGVRSLTSGEEASASLQRLCSTTTFGVVKIDITNDSSIQAAAVTIKERFGKVDVLINNAAIAELVKPGEEGFRESCNKVLDANMTSFLQITNAFLPLLRASSSKPRIINISSARGSVYMQTHEQLPPTASIPYTISKTALNVAMLEIAKLETDVLFQAVSPGHCKTAFNGFRGTKDPLEGAEVVVRLMGDEESQRRGTGFWEFEEGELKMVPW